MGTQWVKCEKKELQKNAHFGSLCDPINVKSEKDTFTISKILAFRWNNGNDGFGFRCWSATEDSILITVLYFVTTERNERNPVKLETMVSNLCAEEIGNKIIKINWCEAIVEQ